jgi:hypothetical protein
MVPRNDIDFGTGTIAVVREPKKVPHLIERKSEVTRSLDEREPVKMGSIVNPIVSRCPIRWRNEAFRLVESDRFDFQSNSAGDFANLHIDLSRLTL